MDAKIFRINYKSDFILTLNSDAGWMTPFCIKFWTGAPIRAFYAVWDGTTYTNCTYDSSEPTKLTVQFDDHHLPIGDLKLQIAYHFTAADFPNDTEDEVINPANITTEIDGQEYQVMLDFTGETAPEIQFSLPAYANEAQRIENEQARIAAETQRVSNEEARIAAEETRQQNEQQRISREEQRIYQEQQRVNAEAERVSEFASLKTASETATTAANNAATLAQQKAQLADDKAALAQAAADLANAKAQLAADKAALAQAAATLANEKAALAQQKAEYAKAQGDYAKAQGDTVEPDHQRAESDHTQAAADHEQAVSDHARAESDHTAAASDHTQAGSDHTRAESDHTTAGSDHTRAESDHTTAGSDHTRAESDHTAAASDHTRAESDHTTAASDHTQAVSDHAQAGQDHTRAENDHTASETATAAASQAATAANNAATAALAAKTQMESQIQQLIENTDAVLGADDIPQFDVTESYAIGDFVMKDGKLYKFITGHTPGAWNPQEVQQTNLVKEVDDMVKSDYEEVIIDLKTESGDPLPNVEVVVTVEGEQSGRNLITDAQGRCTTNVQKGLEYTIEASAPQGYLPSTPIIRRASLPTRYVTITLIEDTQSDYEHLVVTLIYMNQNLGVADHIVVSYSGESYSVPVINNVAESDIPIGVTYTVSFQDIDGYKTPHERSHLAQFAGRDYTMTAYYVDAIAGTRWLMNNGTERDFNDISPADKNDIFGLIVNTGDLAQANCGYIIPVDVMLNGFGSGNYLSANEEISTLGFFGTHAAALTDLDGEQNCEKIRDYITEKATQGITRTSGIAQTVYNKCGGVGVKNFVNNTPYVTGDIVSYQNKLYEFIVDHPTGGWNASQVTEYGIGYIMPDNSIQRCFQPAYGQIYAYRLIIDNVRVITIEVFGQPALNVASGNWWCSTQYNANYGVMLTGGAFYSNIKSNNSYLLPVLAY